MPLFPWQETNNQEETFSWEKEGNLTSSTTHQSYILKFCIPSPISELEESHRWILFEKALGTVCDWGKSTLILSTKAAVVSNHFTLKLSIASQNIVKEFIWFIWTWESNECFTAVWLTEGLVTSHRRVLCEAIECKSQLSMKSHLHIQLKETASCIPKLRNLLLQAIPKSSDLSTFHRIKAWIKISTLNSKWLLQEFWLTHSFFLSRLQGGRG